MSEDVTDAIRDLTRVMIALNGKFATKSDAVRGLSEMGIPNVRVAAILGMKPPDVASILSKDRKRAKREISNG